MRGSAHVSSDGQGAACGCCGHSRLLYVMLMATGGRYIFKGQSAVAAYVIKNNLQMISRDKIVWRFHFWPPFMSVSASLCPKCTYKDMVCCQGAIFTYSVHICSIYRHLMAKMAIPLDQSNRSRQKTDILRNEL